MQIGKINLNIKQAFGQELQKQRLEHDISPYDLAYVLGISHATIYGWECGDAFPGSIIRLKRLAVLFRDVPKLVQNMFDLKGIAPSRREWDKFLRGIYRGRKTHQQKTVLVCGYQAADSRDDQYRIAFGNYLRKERLSRDLTGMSIAEGFGITHACYFRWESGSSFPKEPRTLMMLDKLYGNTVSTIFGLCKNNGIHLEAGEVRNLLDRMKEFDGKGIYSPGKPRPKGW